MKNSKNDYIVEDVVYFDGPLGKAKSLAKETYYYEFLMERKDDKFQGENNFQAATDFAIFEEIFLCLYNKGFLTNSKYNIYSVKIKNGLIFTVNIGKILEDFDLKIMLYDEFNNKNYDYYIDSICQPNRDNQCSFCGSHSFSHPSVFKYSDGVNLLCTGCYSLSDRDKKQIKQIFQAQGIKAAVKARINFAIEQEKPKIAKGFSVEKLLADYKKEHHVYKDSYIVKLIEKAFKQHNINNLEVFQNDDFDLIIWDLNKLKKLENFQKSVATSMSGCHIISLLNNEGVVWINEKATDLVRKLVKDIDINLYEED